ncbi:MAG: TolB family protein [Gemmatimonadaceae bacterium]
MAFQRMGPLTGNYSATYVIDASASSSSHFFDNEGAEGPVLSPDGQHIAFMRFTPNLTGWDSHVSATNGSGVVRVTNFLSEGTPHWSADGSKLVLVVVKQNEDPNVFTQSPVLNASDLTQLTHFTPRPDGMLACPYLYADPGRISLSIQGKITYACASSEIEVIANGTVVATYAASRADPNTFGSVFGAEWSPDGTKVAFIETTSKHNAGELVSNYALRVMNADATNLTTVASVELPAAGQVQGGGGWSGPGNFSLCWMPDASRLVFTIPEMPTVGHLWVVRADGSGLTQLTSRPDVYDRSVSCSR